MISERQNNHLFLGCAFLHLFPHFSRVITISVSIAVLLEPAILLLFLLTVITIIIIWLVWLTRASFLTLIRDEQCSQTVAQLNVPERTIKKLNVKCIGTWIKQVSSYKAPSYLYFFGSLGDLIICKSSKSFSATSAGSPAVRAALGSVWACGGGSPLSGPSSWRVPQEVLDLFFWGISIRKNKPCDYTTH